MLHKSIRASARTLLNQLKTEADFDEFVIDYYFDIKRERFASGMERKQKTNLLLELAPTEELIGHLQTFLQGSQHATAEATGPAPHIADRTYSGENAKYCIGAGLDTRRLVLLSDTFVTEAWSLRQRVAEQTGEQPDELEKLWLVTLGPPHSTVVVAMVGRQFVPFLLDEPTETLSLLSFSPALRVASRYDTRCAAPIDLLGDGGRQLLIAADIAAGSGLGATGLFIFRLLGDCLEQIFAGELDSNMLVGDSDFCEWSTTSYELHPSAVPGKATSIVSTRCRILGDLSATETVRLEWDGRRYVPVETAAAREAREHEQARFAAEFHRIARLSRMQDE